MSFFQFLFSFLYVRNWYTGRYELSRSRFVLFMAGLLLLVLALTIIGFLQAPEQYVAL